MVTSYPSFARSPAQLSPAGPEPITATLFPFLFGFAFGLIPIFLAVSATYLSSLPIETASPLFPLIHTPSHCVSCGQTLPHTAGSELDCAITSDAPSISPFNISCIKAGIFIDTGQPCIHFAFLQLKHLAASAIASSSVYPRHTSSKFLALTSGSCSATATFFHISCAIICHLHIRHIRHDVFRLLQSSKVLYLLPSYRSVIFEALR